MAITTRLAPAVGAPIHLPARNGAEAVIQTLTAYGVEYLFLNPGTDTAPIQEAVVALGRDGHKTPRIVSCLYENVALAAATATSQSRASRRQSWSTSMLAHRTWAATCTTRSAARAA